MRGRSVSDNLSYDAYKRPEDQKSPAINRLKLYGLVKSKNGHLKVRNKIYERFFDHDWCKEHIPRNQSRIVAYISVFVTLLVIGLTGYTYWHGTSRVPGQLRDARIKFLEADSSEDRIESLYILFDPPYWSFAGTGQNVYEARQLFFSLNREEQFDLISYEDERIITIIEGLYVTLAKVDGSEGTDLLLVEMDSTLRHYIKENKEPSVSDSSSAIERLWATLKNAFSTTFYEKADRLQKEISAWLTARKHLDSQEFDDAEKQYDVAIRSIIDSENPSTYYERALVHIALERIEEASSDLERVIFLAQQLVIPVPSVTPTPTITTIPTSTPTTGTDTEASATPSTPTSTATYTPSPTPTPIGLTPTPPSPTRTLMPTPLGVVQN
ncbi:hypothetical protein KFU94_51100 [Chloroflexi bacterium TSY]|nr:hypothetical protein [Chloroflexi bacterium TSY]